MSEPMKIAFQGAYGAYSHAAARAFAINLELVPDFISCHTFGEVFDHAVKGGTAYGVIPLENSSIGSIVANYELLWQFDAFIVDEYRLPVHHQLIAFPGTSIDELQVVYSHPAALDQCRKLFKKHKNLVARVHWDTSGAVAHVKESGNRTSAAIASELAAEEYGMAVIAANVEDFPCNSTRFGLITSRPAKPHALEQQTEIGFPLKISLGVQLPHEVGALARLLSEIASAGGNLTKIESRPIGEEPWHYRFFLDVEVKDNATEEAIEHALTVPGLIYKHLGRYPVQCVGSWQGKIK